MPSAQEAASGEELALRRGQRKRDKERMSDIIAAQRARIPKGAPRSVAKGKPSVKRHRKDGENSDEDAEYVAGTDEESEPEDEEEDDSDDEVQILPNDELASILSSKTVPERGAGNTSHASTTTSAGEKRKRASKASKTASVAVADAVDPLDPAGRPIAGSATRKRSKTYLFFKDLGKKDADTLYECFTCKKVVKVTESMKGSLNNLVMHLKAHSALNVLHDYLKKTEGPASEEHIAMAQGSKPMNEKDTNTLLRSLDEKRETLDKAWARQREAQTEEFNQKKFEALLVDWVVASDQPFTEPEQPQFKAMLEYLHTRGELKIPGRTTIKDRVMGLGSVTVGKVKEMIKVRSFHHCHVVLCSSSSRIGQRKLLKFANGLELPIHFHLHHLLDNSGILGAYDVVSDKRDLGEHV
ncbi:hypothetical protein EXIGLDRAFT_694744 [Exidia glandulosa HHB12029]|uniref:BED-type domain-containing protein n=1 Tax=Exidia glandulosa HHB12029 TaxID=1314781 RepID=A0A165NHR7_EXIGL|nr:hypothetical protein EXIGLDRAFT_694744 [Exidia glandulosa HHB12029]